MRACNGLFYTQKHYANNFNSVKAKAVGGSVPLILQKYMRYNEINGVGPT